MNLILNLYRLQTLDTQRLKIEKRLAEIEQILLADETVQAAALKKRLAETESKSAQEGVQAIQAKVAEKKIKLDLTQSNLFGGKIRSPKELQDLQAESEALRRTISGLEDEQISAMISAEEVQKTLSGAEFAYQSVVNQKASENSLLSGEKRTLEGELPKVDAQRNSLRALIPAETLSVYDSLLKRKGGRAVAVIDDESCDACGYSVSPADMQAARSAAKIVHCKNCGRILYMR